VLAVVDPDRLDSHQRRAVEHDFPVTGWLTGPPGSGKTVVALRRLARLAGERAGRVLYIAPSAVLARIQAAHFRRIAPAAAPRADFAGVCDLARDLLLRRGCDPGHGDVLDLAVAELRRTPARAPYAAVVADEAHDLPPGALRLARLLAGDAPNSLLLVGGAGPSGGVLRTGYRTASGVLSSAGLPATDAARTGGRAQRYVAACQEDHDSELIAAIGSCGQRVGDIAVLTSTSGQALHYRRLLHQARIASVGLDDQDGRPSSAVKVGRIRGSAGLEFGGVFLPGRAAGDPLLPLAVTRARDYVWSGRVLSRPREACGAEPVMTG
jgi:hypothetical protein